MPKCCQFHTTALRCQSKNSLEDEANSSISFIQQNLQDPVIMASYTDSMNAVNRNGI